MTNNELQVHENRVALLVFADGQVLKGKILHVDVGDREQIIFDVLEVVDPGRVSPPPVVGTSVAAKISDLIRIEPLE